MLLLVAAMWWRRPTAVQYCSSRLHGVSPGGGSLNYDGLWKEAQRRLSRTTKKISKKSTRLVDLVPDTPQHLECVGAIESLRQERKDLESLCDLIAAKDGDAAATLAEALGVSDAPPERPARIKKKKGPAPSNGPRKPYWRYSSEAGIEIRVGRSASDNDLLSIEPEHRHPDDLWMHASGYPGSHVVVRSSEEEEDYVDDETELDAVCLAALFSKAVPKVDDPLSATGRAAVSICRARHVSKPSGAKPGLVRLSGDVKTRRVDLATERNRLDRLLKTKKF